MNDLWPKDLTSGTITAPVTILREQATLLGQKTNNIITGEVERIEQASPTGLRSARTMSDFRYSFSIKSSSLRYSYRLFDISHSVDLYPVRFNVDSDIQPELISENSAKLISAADEDEFKSILYGIFNSAKTKRVLQAILAQSSGWSDPTK